MGLEVRGLGVRLGAAGERAQVRRHLLATPALATFATTNQRAALAIAALPPPPHPKKQKEKKRAKQKWTHKPQCPPCRARSLAVVTILL